MLVKCWGANDKTAAIWVSVGENHLDEQDNLWHSVCKRSGPSIKAYLQSVSSNEKNHHIALS